MIPKPRHHIKQFVRFFVPRRNEEPVEVSGKVREITLFRHSNEIGYMVETDVATEVPVNRFLWLVQTETGLELA